jgi:hypothetical protein
MSRRRLLLDANASAPVAATLAESIAAATTTAPVAVALADQ